MGLDLSSWLSQAILMEPVREAQAAGNAAALVPPDFNELALSKCQFAPYSASIRCRQERP
jgi:hypothetical protein